MKRHVAEVALSVLILLLAGWCEAGKKKSKKDQAEAGKAGHGRVAIPVTDTAVQSATEFAVAELRATCEYCNADVRSAYEAMSLKELHWAETKQMAVLEGTMYILNATLQTSVPVSKRTEDNQVIVVFQKADGSYTGISTERYPFLDN